MMNKIKVEIVIEYDDIDCIKQAISTVGGSINFVLKNNLPLKPDSFSIGVGDGEHNDANVKWEITEKTTI